MKRKPANFFDSLRSFIIPENRIQSAPVTNKDILEELVACFDHSCHTEPVGSCLMFNMHFVIILHPDIYEQRLASMPVIVKETVKVFYSRIQQLQKKYSDISPVSSQWHFRFGPGAEFLQDKISPSDIRVIGMLTGAKAGGASVSERQSTARVTMKVKSTNVFDKMDINMDLLRHIHFIENGHFTVRYQPDFSIPSTTVSSVSKTMLQDLAKIEVFNAANNRSDVYIMRDKEIVIARKEDSNTGYNNYLLIDSGFVSNPHARIRFNDRSGQFQIASFSGQETRVDETVISRSEAGSPQWIDLKDRCQILLNGMITLDFKKS